MTTELERVARLAARFGTAAPGVQTGIGDDAAVLSPGAEPLVWTVDAQVEGTHFRLDWLGWRDVGWRSFMAAASDLAAMGAAPVAALSSLVLADAVDDAAFDALVEGQADAARAVGAPVVGGNLARGRETSVTTTLIGRATSPILRSGARPGDAVLLGGAVGLAAGGLALLAAGGAPGVDLQDPRVAACLEAWRRPSARLDLGAAARGVASAAVDVSDGLSRDAAHIAEASGVSIVFEEAALRALVTPPLGAAAAMLGVDALRFVLGGGEDYALLVTSSAPIAGFSRVGAVEAGPAGVQLVDLAGARRAIDPTGFDHFATPSDG